MADLACERSYVNFPVGEENLRGWLYVCNFKCPKESIVKSSYARTVYCSSMEKFFKKASIALLRGKPVTFGWDYFAVRLFKGRRKFVESCIRKGIKCIAQEWYLVVRISKQTPIIFATDWRQVEEYFDITTKKPFITISAADAVTHAITEAVKDMETLATTAMSALELGEYKGTAIGRAMGNYAALSDALAQITSSCLAFGSDFIRRNLRFLACGNFVPIPYLFNILHNLKNCSDARDWDCIDKWVLELDDLIDAYRRPSPPYAPPEREKDIFQFRRPWP